MHWGAVVVMYSIDPERERTLAMADVPEHLQSMGIRRPHLNVVRRWTKKGVRGIPLPTVRCGTRLYTSAEAITWWLQVTAIPQQRGGDACYPISKSTLRTLQQAGIV